MASDQDDIAVLKDQVARLTRLVEGLYARAGEPVPGTDVTLDAPPADIVEALQGGQLIVAIKRWRDYTGLGLAEAKAEMEELSRRLGW